MCARRSIPLLIICALAVGLPAFSMTENRYIRPPTPPTLQSARSIMSPPMLSSGGDTTWVQVHTDSSQCPGDPLMGHGGEATGGPGPLETWCFEGGPGDTCGTNPPWDVLCFSHEDVRAMPSQTGINFWHIDSYRADQRIYCGDYSLWCGSDSLWEGSPVECGTWQSPPGYGNLWNCVAQLTLPATFDVANGCTLFFDPRYDTECKYDYLYVDFWDGDEWRTLAAFNATSDNPGPECGLPSGGNPDYWGNTDVDRLLNVDWQDRSNPSLPAFTAAIDPGQYSYASGPMFRWRFASDGSWSDADGRSDTDGGAWIDNVWVYGDDDQYTEDFESGVLDPNYWSLPGADGVLDAWHIVHDPDPPYEGGDGGYPISCTGDSSYVYRARPEQGYKAGAPWRNGWYYRLISPAIPITNTGCVIQFDAYECYMAYTCDYTDKRVRFFDGNYGTWCPWIDVDGIPISAPCYRYFNRNEDLTPFMRSTSDSVQFAWELIDVSSPGELCWGKHNKTDYQIDNVSVGFYDASATRFYTRCIDLLHDTFSTDICGYNSGFAARNPDTLDYYAGEAHDLPYWNQLRMEITDVDELSAVELYGSVDGGSSWAWRGMTLRYPADPGNPAYGGEYSGTLCPSDFGIAEWDTGTTVWYYVKATDALSNAEYCPGAAHPGSPQHTGTSSDNHTFSVLPLVPSYYEEPRILLVNGYRTNPTYWIYDWDPCLSTVEDKAPLVKVYEDALSDAGYCFDTFDINGAGSNVHIHPIWFDSYDAVIWFTGPYYSTYLIDKQAQVAIRNFLGAGGKVLLCGDRLAYNMAPIWLGGEGADSLDSEFLSGIMGCEYLEEMDSPYEKPYVYLAGESSLEILGTPSPIDIDTLLAYRECPFLKDMSWVRTNANPPTGYTAQPLLTVLNPDMGMEAHGAIYTEYQQTGQCVFVDFDLSAFINHEREYCGGGHPSVPPYTAGYYDGRVDLIRLVLEDIFALPSGSGGKPGAPDPARTAYVWRLLQNAPNPCAASTSISYEIARPCRVRITVYNTQGQVVRLLVDETAEAGRHSVAWDGRTAPGRRVSSGVYFYRMDAGPYTATRKLLLIN